MRNLKIDTHIIFNKERYEIDGELEHSVGVFMQGWLDITVYSLEDEGFREASKLMVIVDMDNKIVTDIDEDFEKYNEACYCDDIGAYLVDIVSEAIEEEL